MADIDKSFGLDENNDLKIVSDEEEIKQSIINILTLDEGEKPFDKDFGAKLNSYLHEDISNGVITGIENLIEETLSAREQRISDIIAYAEYVDEKLVIRVEYEFDDKKFTVSNVY
jgi:phage baseplate assembly protein W